MHWVASGEKNGSPFVYACDLGTDKVDVYRLLPETGKLERTEGLDGSTPPGSGPRHGVFGDSGRTLYVNNEMGNSVTSFKVDDRSGKLTAVVTVPTLPQEVLRTEGAKHLITTSEIALHPNGRWLYVSNRGDDSVTTFRVLKEGLLNVEAVTKLVVRMPRGFAIDPSGRWLVVGGQDSNDLASYRIDPETGSLKPSGHLDRVNKPVCVSFLAR
jgi:6-phosphogluconolactonase